jgi:hypothetical protein
MRKKSFGWGNDVGLLAFALGLTVASCATHQQQRPEFPNQNWIMDLSGANGEARPCPPPRSVLPLSLPPGMPGKAVNKWSPSFPLAV